MAMLRLEAELEESHPRKEEWPVQSTEVQRPSGVTAWRVRKPWPGWSWKGWGWLGRVIEQVSQAHLCVKIHPALGREQLRGRSSGHMDTNEGPKAGTWAVHIGEARTERGLFMA